MATLKEFEDALRAQGMTIALGILDGLRQRDRAKRSAAPARRVAGRKMTPDVARQILELHASTEMTQQEIAFKLGVNQGRVNEVIKRGKWLDGNLRSPEAQARDKAMAKMKAKPVTPRQHLSGRKRAIMRDPPRQSAVAKSAGDADRGQLSFGGL